MNEKTVLRVAHIEENTDLLGPYNRFVIWVHGCCFDCDGCIAHNTKFGSFDEESVTNLSRRIIQSGCEGVTISGGEPFLQASALSELISAVRSTRDVGIIAYSGFTLDELKGNPQLLPMLSKIDILIDGKYEKAFDDGRAYVGSSNQKVHYLTERYREVGKEYYSQRKRRAEIKFTPNQAILIGVPSQNTFRVWQELREKSGGLNNDF